jgi:putative effector of murein hydrolase
MNVHQPILPTTTIVVPNVYVLGIQYRSYDNTYQLSNKLVTTCNPKCTM